MVWPTTTSSTGSRGSWRSVRCWRTCYSSWRTSTGDGRPSCQTTRGFVIGRMVIIAAFAIAIVAVANSDRGLPYATLIMLGAYIFWTFISQRTRFGRHVYAVGGNKEAARRAGINVKGIQLAVFAISSLMAAIGGLVLASRLSSVDTATGGGTILLYSIAAAVIGGTSLFGGR